MFVFKKDYYKNDIVINKSKFILNAKSVDNKKDALDFIEEISNKYNDATHNIPAYIVCEDNNEIKYYSSDKGEPVGSAKKPILDYLLNLNVVNFALVVSRYFGGIKLGKGGLIRAYKGIVTKTITKDELTNFIRFKNMSKKIYYKDLKEFEKEVLRAGGEILDIKYEDILEVKYKLPISWLKLLFF